MLVLPLVGLLTSCQTTNKEIGAGIGAVTGAAVGAFFGEGAGKAIAIGLGGFLGTVIGSSIGQGLDDEEVALANAAQSTVLSKPEAEKVNWTSPTRKTTHGYSEVTKKDINEDEDLPALRDPTVKIDNCREVKSVVYTEGHHESETEIFCLKEGRWVSASLF